MLHFTIALTTQQLLKKAQAKGELFSRISQDVVTTEELNMNRTLHGLSSLPCMALPPRLSIAGQFSHEAKPATIMSIIDRGSGSWQYVYQTAQSRPWLEPWGYQARSFEGGLGGVAPLSLDTCSILC